MMSYAHEQKTKIRVRLREKEVKKEPHVNTTNINYLLQKAEFELEKLIGVENVKAMVREIYAWVHINRCREKHQLKTEAHSMHMIFKGNPGTGKTTAARLVGRLLKDLGYLSKGHFIEAERADLVGEYIGQTAQKTRELLQKAHGGVLFIDEAYALNRGGEKDFGKEAVDTLVKAMDEGNHSFILILAGYSKEMEQFITLNPGLPSRFPIQLDFPDFSMDQMMMIAENMLQSRDYVWTIDAKEKLKKKLDDQKGRAREPFSNGRAIRNAIEKAIRSHAVRIVKEQTEKDIDALKTLTERDF
ncbi:stage V sporulation protein [Geomicrobium sp. JCM 19038]|nr:stage V sporulation protein [Geomicrobium sp. JCM 19038]